MIRIFDVIELVPMGYQGYKIDPFRLDHIDKSAHTFFASTTEGTADVLVHKA